VAKKKVRVEFFDYRGAVHIHTKHSDGSGSLKRIVKAGLKSFLDFMIISDHDTLYLKEHKGEGWYENQLLVLVGEEASFGNEHVLALNVTEALPKDLPPEEGFARIKAQGGLAFVVHPHGKYKIGILHRDYRWRHWHLKACSGIEIWSYMFDWISKVSLFKLPYYFFFPGKAITGPFPETLNQWDGLAQKHRVPGIGGLDVHARGIWPIVVFSYRKSFRTVLTHVLLEQPLSKNLPRDSELIHTALAEGHAYVAYEKAGDPRGFRFILKGPLNFAIMGDEVIFDPEDVLEVELPEKAQIRILRNGKPQMVGLSSGLSMQVREPGVYRVDVYKNGRPWIFSNPIYVRQADAVDVEPVLEDEFEDDLP